METTPYAVAEMIRGLVSRWERPVRDLLEVFGWVCIMWAAVVLAGMVLLAATAC
jgi:hypothetical protein